ncbi:unnamed protein product [Meloidogyne enterolobii]|uniref:Uncharacterized protein n=1 Tax=Meloidogyne enterolobii TaxID=390850 RepID=A0ACB0ZAG4_MELEN
MFKIFPSIFLPFPSFLKLKLSAVQHERGPRQSTMRKQMLLMNGLQQQRQQQRIHNQNENQHNNGNKMPGQRGRLSLIRSHSRAAINPSSVCF